jgi:hypothetical protein
MLGRTRCRHAILIVAATLLGACATTIEKGAVGVERKQLLLVSSAEMDQGAIQAYQQTLGQASQKDLLNATRNRSPGSARSPPG